MDTELQVEFALGRDKAGAKVLTELKIYYPGSEDEDFIPPFGGITARVLRSVSLYGLIKKGLNEEDYFSLTNEQEDIILGLVKRYPRHSGRAPMPEIYLASTAYLYEKAVRENPFSPAKSLAKTLGVKTETLMTRIAKAKKSGFLHTSQKKHTRTGGNAWAETTEKAQQALRDYLSKPHA
jgi:hypothetical protein